MSEKKVTGCYRCGHQDPEGQPCSKAGPDGGRTYYCEPCWETMNGAAPLWVDGKPYYPDRMAAVLRAKEGSPTLSQVQEYRLGYEAEFGCCPACGRFDGVSTTTIPSDIEMMWGGRLDFETLPESEGEMRALIRAKLQPVGDALLQAWRERKK